MIATLAATDLPAATLDALVTRADGVPLFVEELTTAVTELGAARGVDAIPASLADSLMGRVDRLSTAKEVAQRAAVLGREFGYPLLAAMVDMDEGSLRRSLGRLVDAEILFVRGEPPTATYTFKHALIQETAYESLLKRAAARDLLAPVEAKRSSLLDSVENHDEEIVITHNGRAATVVVSPAEFESWVRLWDWGRADRSDNLTPPNDMSGWLRSPRFPTLALVAPPSL